MDKPLLKEILNTPLEWEHEVKGNRHLYRFKVGTKPFIAKIDPATYFEGGYEVSFGNDIGGEMVLVTPKGKPVKTMLDQVESLKLWSTMKAIVTDFIKDKMPGVKLVYFNALKGIDGLDGIYHKLLPMSSKVTGYVGIEKTFGQSQNRKVTGYFLVRPDYVDEFKEQLESEA